VLVAIATESSFLAAGNTEKFQSRVAHAVQTERPAKPAPRTKPGPRGKEPPVEKKTEPQGSLAEKLRRWFGV